MALEVIWGVLAAAALIVALALLVLLVALLRLMREARATLASGTRLLALLEAELPPTLGHMRDLTAKLDELADQLPPRLEHLDALLDEGDETLAALRSSAEATEQVVRVPLDAMKRVQRGLRIGGSGGRQRPDVSGAGTARERERA